MEKMAWDGPKWGREDFFPTNPGLANILGRTDLIFENFYFFHFLDPKILDFQVPKFWISQKSGFPGLQKIHTAAGGRGADGRTGGNLVIIPARPRQGCWVVFCFVFMAHFFVWRGLKMILSQRAPSSLNMSSYRAIWTHSRPTFIFSE